MKRTVGIIDYGRGNLRSVAKALEAVGARVVVGDRPGSLDNCSGLLLPGVGAFADSMDALGRRGFLPFLKRVAGEGRPLLGVCLGLQLFCESSTEFGIHRGLGFFPEKITRFRPELKVPHMGWNQVRQSRRGPFCPLLTGLPQDSEFYFVHSYRLAVNADKPVAGVTQYGDERFASVLWKDNVFATQFHPEKSQKAGLKLYANYWKLVQAA